MRGTIVTLVVAFAAGSLALPRGRRSTDELQLSNEVFPGPIEVETGSSVQVVTTKAPEAALVTNSYTSVSKTLPSTKAPALDDEVTPKPGKNRNKNKQLAPPPAANPFSRVIDDIFNIPITVLRAVNTLLSNAFGHKNAAVQNVESATSSEE